MNRRSVLRALLAIFAFLATTAASLLLFAQDRFFDADDFGATAAATLSEPEVNDYLAQEISDALIAEVPELATGGSLLRDVTSSVLESSAAASIVETSVTETHRTVFEDGADTFVLDVSDLVVEVEQLLNTLAPDVADEVPESIGDIAVDISSGRLFNDLFRLAEALRSLTLVFAGLAVLALVALVFTDRSPWHGISTVGTVLGLVGVTLLIAEGVGAIVLGSFGSSDLQRDALSAAWHLVFGELLTWGWLLVAAGAFLAGLAWAVSNLDRARSGLQTIVARVTERPNTRAGQLIRLAAVFVTAVWAVVSPLGLVTAVLRIAGFVLAIGVVAEVVQLLGLDERLAKLAPDNSDVRSWRSILVQAGLPLAVISLLGVGGASVLQAEGGTALADVAGVCNGHDELCDRRLDEVAIAASHNSMSSTTDGYYLPNQTNTMIEQLDDGIRGLLIDTWYGRDDPDGPVVTQSEDIDLEGLDEATRDAVTQAQARSTEGFGPELVYLCHSLCEIGSLPAVEELTEIREWLDDHPTEILVFVVQDATEPADTAAMFEDAGFGDYVLTQELGQPFPTLQEMIDSGRRVFVMVEEDGGDIEWLHPAFEFGQETPFSFSAIEDLSCEPNRGRDASPLFMVNHFLTPAINSNRDINEADVLAPRLEQCQDERGLLPNLVAADFVAWGDLIEVVDDLNGVG